MDLELQCWRVDPNGGGLLGWLWGLVDEAVLIVVEGAIEDLLACGVDLVGLAVVDLVGGHQADA